jgi:hypothetical protein
MRNLFGCGLHPLADVRAQQFEGSDLTLDTIQKAMRLGPLFGLSMGRRRSGSKWRSGSLT